MTEKTFNEAKEILEKIEYIGKLRRYMFSNPTIKEKKDDYEYIYLSWADNENGELKQTIIHWCDNEIKRLQTMFNEL